MKNLPLVFILILFQIKTFGMMEREWLDNTPFNGAIYYYEDVTKGISYYNKTADTTKTYHLDNLVKWYFYKGNTIGIFAANDSENQYFVGDEMKHKLVIFKNEQDFKNFINKNELKPFYIRWHSDVWSFNPEKDSDFGIGTFFLAIIVFPIVFVCLIFIKNESSKSVLVFIFTIIPILYIINYLLGEFPQSL